MDSVRICTTRQWSADSEGLPSQLVAHWQAMRLLVGRTL